MDLINKPDHYESRGGPGPASFTILVSLCTLSVVLASCERPRRAPPPASLPILVDQAPQTLDPRLALEATGQRLGELLFRALTRLDSELAPHPDLASRWESSDGARE